MARDADLFITFAAIAEYLGKARQAQQQFQESKDIMSKAAGELLDQWKGDAADAFAVEQGNMQNWCAQLLTIASEYMEALKTVMQGYEATEQELYRVIGN